MKPGDVKIEVYGPPGSDYNVIEDCLTAKLEELQIRNINIGEVSSICNLVLQSKNYLSRIKPKKLRKKSLGADRDAFKLLNFKLDSYASDMVESFLSQCSGFVEADYTVFKAADRASQQTLMILLPLLRLLEENKDNVAPQANESPFGWIRKLKFKFLECLFQREAGKLRKLLELSWKIAREDRSFLTETTNLTRRIYEMLQSITHKTIDFSIEAIYLENTTSFASTLNPLPATDFLTHIIDIIVTEQKITSSLSLTTRETARVTILNQTIFSPGALGKLVHSLARDYRVTLELNRTTIKHLQELAKRGGQSDVFLHAIVTGIYSAADQAISRRWELPALQRLICYHEEIFCLLFLDCTFKARFEAYWEAYCKAEMRATKMASGISKLLNEDFKRSRHSNFSIQLWTRILTRMIELFGLSDTIGNAFVNNCILRRAIKEGDSFLRYIFDPALCAPELQVCDTLLCQNLSGNGRLRSVKHSLQRSVTIQQQLDSFRHLGLIILSEKDMELFYKPSSATLVRLPKSLQSVWNTVTENFVGGQNSVIYKKRLTLIPMLSTIEVETPFICANSRPLRLQLNLLQATVLIQFDEHNSLSFHEVQDRTEINTSLLKTSLESLVNTGILLQKNAQYTFNDDFEPVRSKNDSNIVRVDFHGHKHC
ncbi:uncharacterized protein LALA0_S13e01442g [Lachancea lanzarotensis]|uniref:LALA0S13e01442g1_1 n=1 Tax=Lachancea lanzarotensis TaxID=1245769 RepID=A0A0C7NG99_9SACH|nr:uncharacterized protein LALA0_S13e01442g [Lachancea lanzarotensis]CEP64717.1 LALA0S13e01442g1_1 [Lachancea lanzarotensis]